MKKRILSLLMAACLTLALAPAALATAATMTQSELENAISSASSGGTVTLTGDVTLASPLTIDKAITIDGTANKYSITAPANQHALSVSVSGVQLKNLKINATGGGYAVSSTGSSLTVTDCEISAVARGISFYPTNGSGATLNVSGTVIKNTAVGNYDTTANYSGDNRGIATANVLGGTVTISNSSILGFKYSINAVVSPESSATVSLRDGKGTHFDISGSTIKGWTALNAWSAATNFTFTDCTLVGISTLSGDSNNYATISVNDGIYGWKTNKSSTIKFVGGTVTAAKLSTAAQSVLNVDVELQTKYIFEQFYNEDERKNEPVVVSYYGSENTAGSPVRQVLMWNFYPTTTKEASDNYLDTMVVGDGNNVSVIGGTVDEYTGAAPAAYAIDRADVKRGLAANERGGEE